MSKKLQMEAQNPLILRCNRLMEAFAKSDDERDFYLDRTEGFIIYVNLDKPEEDLLAFEKELKADPERYCMIPKLTFYETKKIMEGFVNEKVYDIDTKEKLLDIIHSKEARVNFLDFIYDHHSELEKWQQYYQERSRIRIIEWLRTNNFQFVFEEDLDFTKNVIENLKRCLFETKIGKDIAAARKVLASKAKIYYSNEALNPRPKRGRPPKQVTKIEMEPQVTPDIYTTVPQGIRTLLFTPDISSAMDVTFSSKFETGEELIASRKSNIDVDAEFNLESLNQKLAALRSLSEGWKGKKDPLEVSDRKPVKKQPEPTPPPEKPRTTTPAKKMETPKAISAPEKKRAIPKLPTTTKGTTPVKLPPKPKKTPLQRIRKTTTAAPQKKAAPKPKIKAAAKPKATTKKKTLLRRTTKKKTK